MSGRDEEGRPGRRRRRGGGFIPLLCNLMGTLILLIVVGTGVLLVFPRFKGDEIYNIVSGSMEPEIPVGSIVYVRSDEPGNIQEGDIIAFWSGESVIVHRVMENRTLEGVFVTKGDANAAEDMRDIGYDALIGRVTQHYPFLGRFLTVYTSTIGKIYALCFAACGVMFNLLAGRIRERRREG